LNYYLIFSNPRSGSTTLAHFLNEAINGRFVDEPFHPKKQEDLYSFNSRERLKSGDSIESVLTDVQKEFEGFKYLYGVSDPLMIQYDEDVIRNANKTIFLHRKNVFKATLSLKIAYFTDKYQAYDNEVIGSPSFRIKPSNFEKRFEKLKNFYPFVRSLRDEIDSITLTYKDLYYNKRDEKISEVLDFFDLDYKDRSKIENLKEKWFSGTNKLNSKSSYSEIVENLKEIKGRFGSKKWGK